MTQPFDFTGRHVFVAGGTSGINLGIAAAFAKAGATLGVLSRAPEKVRAAVDRLGPGAWGQAADVRSYDEVAAALVGAVARSGPIDVLVSGAAGNFVAPALGMSANGFKAVVDIDLLGTFNVARAGFEHLRRPGASLINISAPQAVNARALQSHVCAAKAGIDMLTRCLALEWGPEGVRVNGIIPGPIEGTEGMARLAPTEAAAARVRASVPLRRYGTIEDVANLALFLASPLASYINGAIVPWTAGPQPPGAPASSKRQRPPRRDAPGALADVGSGRGQDPRAARISRPLPASMKSSAL
jgi:NAD(P)-dependent dehydrogenase (short-subunit alcohol dehydrogenase family)